MRVLLLLVEMVLRPNGSGGGEVVVPKLLRISQQMLNILVLLLLLLIPLIFVEIYDKKANIKSSLLWYFRDHTCFVRLCFGVPGGPGLRGGHDLGHGSLLVALFGRRRSRRRRCRHWRVGRGRSLLGRQRGARGGPAGFANLLRKGETLKTFFLIGELYALPVS